MAFSIATFNVKDLLGGGDTPGAREAHNAKLDWLAEMIARVDADVLGLQEVGPATVLEELCDRVATRGGRAAFRERIVGTADDRGIRNALVSRVRVITSAIHAPSRLDFPVFQAGDPPPFGDRIPMRRGIVHAAVDGGALGQVDVLVAHLKSKRRLFLRDAAPTYGSDERQRSNALSGRELAEAELRSLVWRCSEALFVRGLVDGMLGSDPGARIAVVGDLNDQPGSLVARIVAGTGPDELRSGADLVPPERRFSILHRGGRELLDHVLLTRNLYAQATGAELHNEALRDHGELGLAAIPPVVPPAPPPPEPPATPDSDHAPLVVRFG